ncbi:MAG: hypothetical protein HZA54_03540 [Planctomycetes bacterium]|nr:hypothetical protein [Planctomycetota bacterium]
MPDQVAVGKAYDAFDAGGALKDGKQQAAIARLGDVLATTLARLND